MECNRRTFLKVAAGALAYRQGSPSRVVDAHSHYFPKAFLESLRKEGQAPGFDVDFADPDRPVLVQGSVRTTFDPTYWDLEKRVQRMDSDGIGVHVLSLTTPMVHWAPIERSIRLARIVNDAIVDAHNRFPNRFVGCATLPVQAPDSAIAEIERLSGKAGIRAVCLPTSFADLELSHPSLFPIYQRCESLNLPVALHPVTVLGSDRLLPYYLRNLLGNPYDTGVAATSLIFGGVLDRFPRLNVVLPHAGGAFPYLAGRLERGQSVRPEIQGKAQHPVGEYLRRFHYDTITHSFPQLRFLVDLVGADRILMGSDYCFDMGDDHPIQTVDKLGLSSGDRDKILSANAQRLFRL